MPTGGCQNGQVWSDEKCQCVCPDTGRDCKSPQEYLLDGCKCGCTAKQLEEKAKCTAAQM